MKHSIRLFSLGILVATAILATVYFIEEEPTEIVEQESYTQSEMITMLENDGYYIYTEERVLESEIDTQEPLEDEEQDETETIEDSNENTVETITITIEAGTSVNAVADTLFDEGLISNQDDFISFLAENEYGTKIQIGEFELHTGMDQEQIARTITNSP
ncbi:endolytic transglycosylase MltG [Saliterribacillus persicus]|uniref:YceG-like family protein n=1 Tax=Saliterribacillus persicus TaxID=930114 RepID=A0A368XDS0_9BACI|nr:endolytic transglycosylase MltG [Saliterribacillus persicus]RCW65366.1 YceG-like family protein [Saliterribacillus persicus]